MKNPKYVLLKPILPVGQAFDYTEVCTSMYDDVYECILGLDKDHCAMVRVDGEFVRNNPDYFLEIK